MGEPPCDVLEVEMALDRVEGEVRTELPAHVRAFARAHADGRPAPAAPFVLRRESTLATARAACGHELVAERGLALLRLAAPLAIEGDPAVAWARAQPRTWANLALLTAARDTVARSRFGCTAVELLHRLHGVDAVAAAEPAEPGPQLAGWQERDADVEHAAIVDLWHALAARFGVTGHVRVDRAVAGVAVQPRTFVVEPGLEVVVVVPHEVATPAARFAVLHELGHAAAALASLVGVPRALDEAVASYVARIAEPPSWLPARWTSELLRAARRRRIAIAASLDWAERALPARQAPVGAVPPWALWHDPGAQASYLAAEVIAERLHAALGASPPRGQLARVLGSERDAIDRRTRVL
jgi:hypothetical protein